MRTTILLYIEKLRLDIKNSLKEDEQNYELIPTFTIEVQILGRGK